MNRLLRNLFFALAGLFAAYAALFANYLRVAGWGGHGKIVIGAAAISIFLALAGWFFPLKIKFKIFMLLLGLLLVELVMQVAAGLGVLPGLEIKDRAPFARVYWTPEGFSNGIRNRFGWYAPAFDLKAAHKIALIGDSQVEGLEVPRTQNQAADLQKLLNENPGGGWSVMSLGWRGICPAFAPDILDYARRHFQPQEAIVVVSIGSDVSESSPAFCHHPPQAYIFYDFDSRGQLVMNPASANTRARFDRDLELNHWSLLFNLPAILNSYFMIMQTVDSVHDNLARRRLRSRADDADGFNPGPFAVNPTPEGQHAMKILLAELAACKTNCEEHGIKFRLATIPSFRPKFFQTQHGRDWTTAIGGIDYFKPEREVAAWARANGIPVASVGEYIRQKKMDVEEIHGLYFKDGTGHLTLKGHALCARAIYEAFYKNSPP
jgi:hypothetical protein